MTTFTPDELSAGEALFARPWRFLKSVPGLDLLPAADGTIDVKHNTARPLSEPGAKLRFTNARTSTRAGRCAVTIGSRNVSFIAGLRPSLFESRSGVSTNDGQGPIPDARPRPQRITHDALYPNLPGSLVAAPDDPLAGPVSKPSRQPGCRRRRVTGEGGTHRRRRCARRCA